MGTGTKLTCAFKCECVCFSLVYILFLGVFSRNTSAVSTVLVSFPFFSLSLLFSEDPGRSAQKKKKKTRQEFHVNPVPVACETVRNDSNLFSFALHDNQCSSKDSVKYLDNV